MEAGHTRITGVADDPRHHRENPAGAKKPASV